MIAKIAKIAGGLLFLGLLLLAGLIAAFYVFQRSLIYPIPPNDRPAPDSFEQIHYATSDGLELTAGYYPALEGMPTLLFFHGNGGSWQTTALATESIVARGYGVLAAEYRGYAGNPGSPSEEGLYRDGAAALGWLRSNSIADSDIVVVGNSLGSGVATQLATTMQPRALILVSPFKSLVATAANAYPWLPVDWLLEDRYENIAKIGDVAAPLLVVHGEMDGLIPIAHARELAAAHRNARFVALPGMGHNMWIEPEAQLPQLLFLDELRH
jgi:fermentation-respiration switch protein FrsA (DUF1100 family)